MTTVDYVTQYLDSYVDFVPLNKNGIFFSQILGNLI